MTNPVFPVGLVKASVNVAILALAERNVFFELAVIDITVDEPDKFARDQWLVILPT